ncbi:MAG: hypothetical protein ACYTG0_00995 [Planctomycetota bacterium]|jgi:hypothetical protein
MRLTLRAMLAYMDDILPSEDAEEIGRKIEESEYASSLLHRTRDVMRRLGIGAPGMSERAARLDPNTVADYLDHTLAHERVPDFEKVCLESSVHLAEVASCHQILAVVLGEPAEVDMASRQRMYRLPDLVAAQAEAASEAADSTTAKPAESPAADRGKKPQPSVPGPDLPERFDDLQPSRRGWWPAVAAVSLGLLCVVLVLAATGQFKPGSHLMGLFGLGEPDDATARAEVSPAEHETTAAPGGADAADLPTGPSESKPPLQDERPSEPGRVGGPTDVAEPGDAVTPSGKIDTPAPVGEADPGAPTSTGPASETTPGAPLAQPHVTGPDAHQGVTAADQPTAGAPSIGPAPLPPETVGRLESVGQVLLELDTETAAWQRMKDQTPLLSQTFYLSLPTYQPEILVSDAVRLRLIGGTQIRLVAPDQDGVAGIEVKYGRLAIEAADEAAARFHLSFGDRSGLLSFADAGSKVAMEVSRADGTNVDPETQPAPLTADLYVTSGKILWQEGTSQVPVAVNEPLGLSLNEHPLEAVAVPTLPNWIAGVTMKVLDESASAVLQRELKVERAAIVGLRELALHRKKEVRWLALRCLEQIGDYELMVAELDYPDPRAWLDCVAELRTAVRRSPLAAAQVRTAMEKLHGDEGAGLYEMLWKYGGALDKDGADRLVGCLRHDTLAFRRLGFWNLQRITGWGFYYKPEDTAAKRELTVQKWEERLESGSVPQAKTQDDPQSPPLEGDSSDEGLQSKAEP